MRDEVGVPAFPALYIQFYDLLPVFLIVSDITFDSCTMEQKKTSTGQPNLVKLPMKPRVLGDCGAGRCT